MLPQVSQRRGVGQLSTMPTPRKLHVTSMFRAHCALHRHRRSPKAGALASPALPAADTEGPTRSNDEAARSGVRAGGGPPCDGSHTAPGPRIGSSVARSACLASAFACHRDVRHLVSLSSQGAQRSLASVVFGARPYLGTAPSIARRYWNTMFSIAAGADHALEAVRNISNTCSRGVRRLVRSNARTTIAK